MDLILRGVIVLRFFKDPLHVSLDEVVIGRFILENFL